MDIRNVKVDYARGRVGSLWQEFKAFAFKGNLIDLAVAFVLGAAFTKVITAVVNGFVMPIVSVFDQSVGGGWQQWHVWRFPVGMLMAELLNFLIIAAVLFVVIVKLVGSMMKSSPPPAPGEPTTKECPYCLSVIPLKARRCAHCTSDVSGPETAPGGFGTPAVALRAGGDGTDPQ